VQDLPFASFFLSKLLHGVAFLDDLQSLDPQLYKSLLFLKSYDGDVEDLGLVFAVDEEVFGEQSTIDLKPGGRFDAVTKANRAQYLHLLADYHMNKKIKEQSAAFLGGFKEVIPDRWLRIFSTAQQVQLTRGC